MWGGNLVAMVATQRRAESGDLYAARAWPSGSPGGVRTGLV
jgi:hypothetical protein